MTETSNTTTLSPRAAFSAGGTIDDSCVACRARLPRTGYLRISGGFLARCENCQSWTSLPRPTVQSQASLHDTAEYFDHPYFQARREDKNLAAKRCRIIFSQISKYIDTKSLRGELMLDIGCDVGSLLAAAAESFGIIPIGLDVAERAVQAARSRGLQVFHGTIEQAPVDFSSFKIATAVDIVEHATDPANFLRSVRERMAAGGILYVQTPNCESVIYKLGWQICRATNGRPRGSVGRLFPPQHIQYFNRRGFQLLARRTGFEIVDIQTRTLPVADIVTSALVRAGLMGLQAIDSLGGRQILLCTVLKKS
jgi:SAM-dependent methyltransferase